MSEGEAEVANQVANQVVSDPVADPADAALEGMRAAGAQRLAPVRLRYLEALDARMQAQREAVRQQLDARVDAAVADGLRHCEGAEGDGTAQAAMHVTHVTRAAH